METLGREVKQQEQKKTNVRKFISVVKKYTDMAQLDAIILREFVEQIRVSDTYMAGEQQKRVKIREIEIVYNFIDALMRLILRECGSNPKLPQRRIMRKSAQLNAAPALA